MKKTKFLAVLWIATICLGFVQQPLMVLARTGTSNVEAYASTIYSKYSIETPILDGTLGATEWKDANYYEDVGSGNIFDVYLMHREDYFYIGIRWADDTEEGEDLIAVFFDEGDDGGYGSGSGDGVFHDKQEDLKLIYGDGRLKDGRWDTIDGQSGWYWRISPAPGAVNFEASIDYHANRWEAEFKIPFVGNDGHSDDWSDLNIERGDTIGICFEIKNARDGSFSTFPTGADPNDPDDFLALKFDDDPPVVSGIDYSPKQPRPTDAVTVTAEVTDAVSAVKYVVLRYSTDGGDTWISVPMTGGSAYTGTIPKNAEGTTVQFKVVAEDNAGFVTESAFTSYTVQPQPPLCIIATTTFGSELTPEVQFLREFRDQTVLSTFAGVQFMQAFNAWYYSFSPSVADFIASQPVVKAVMRGVLYPLIGILHLSSMIYSAFSFSPELGVVVAGFVASSLIGAVYFTLPATVLLAVIKRFKKKTLKTMQLRLLTISWLISLALIILGEVTALPAVMMTATALFVLITLGSSATIVANKIAERFP